MLLAKGHISEKPEGQATFEMANLRQKTTGLPFVVWVSQKDNIQHDLRVKVGYNAKIFPALMGNYSVRPFAFVGGQQLHHADERLLRQWIEKNSDTLVRFWDGDIEFTEDMIDKIQSL